MQLARKKYRLTAAMLSSGAVDREQKRKARIVHYQQMLEPENNRERTLANLRRSLGTVMKPTAQSLIHSLNEVYRYILSSDLKFTAAASDWAFVVFFTSPSTEGDWATCSP